LNNTILQDRTLWYDGDSTLSETKIMQLISEGISPDGLYVDKTSENIKQYNRLVKPKEQIRIKQSIDRIEKVWILPKPYDTLNVVDHVIELYVKRISSYKTDREELKRMERITNELALYTKFNLMDVLRVLIYIINTLQKNNLVWGVGRGSSVSSYVLYLIGVHDVDSYKYELDISDFLH
jgi:DNA polymerase III alpha subunit